MIVEKPRLQFFLILCLRVRVRSGACLKWFTFKWNFPQSTLYLSVSMSVCPTQLGAVVWVLVGLGQTWKKIFKKNNNKKMDLLNEVENLPLKILHNVRKTTLPLEVCG